MRALTIRQPWAAFIAHSDKRIENRVWPTSYRGTLLIHAGKTVDRGLPRWLTALARTIRIDQGAVIAVARLTDSHPDDGECTRWSARGQFHHVLDDVTVLRTPVSHRGALGLWIPPAELVERVRLQLDDDTADRLLGEEAV